MMLRRELRMAGRHLWPPSCRAIGAARSPSLQVVKERCLPSHHHHQLDSSPQIKNPSFLDSGMMGKEVMAADRQSPSCGNIPPRKSAAPALPVKETNDGHVTSDGGGSPSAGALSPSDGGGFPLAGALSSGDDGGPPSAGPSPGSWRDPSRHHHTSSEAKITAFLGVGMLQRKVDRLYSWPSSSCLVVKEVACDGGGSPPAGLLLPFSRPDPSRPQQRRPRLATFGSLPSLAGYCSAPGTPPRCCSMVLSSRLFSTTIPPPVQSKVDLLKVDKIWAAGDKSLSSVELAMEKIEKPVQRVDGEEMLASLKLDLEACKSYQDKEKVLKKFYQDKIRPALVARGLVSPYTLSDKQGFELHKEIHRITSCHPKYMTALELTMELTSMAETLWTHCFDFLSEQRCLVIEDWDNHLGMSIATFVFDRTLAFDGSTVYRGECDASHKTIPKPSKGAGSINGADKGAESNNGADKGAGHKGVDKDGAALTCSAIWNHIDQVLSTILIKEFGCKTSNMAEVIAMYVLLKDGMRLGLHKEFFQGCSDSKLVYRILCGLLPIDPNDNSLAAQLNRLLKYMRKYFGKLLPKWESREKMFFVDGIMREARCQNMLANEEFLEIRSLVRKTLHFLAGNPVFKFVQKSTVVRSLPGKRSSPLDLQFENASYVEVDEGHKIDVLWHITSALRPAKVLVVMFESESRVDCNQDINYLFGDYAVSRVSMEGYSFYTIDVINASFPTILNRRSPNKNLLIYFDATISQQETQKLFQIPDLFTVLLTTASERDHSSKLHEFSPLSFVSFHQGSSTQRNGGGNGKRINEVPNADDLSLGPDDEAKDI